MVLTKEYDRFAPAGVCGIITSPAANIVQLNAKTIAVAACECVYIWDLRKCEKLVSLVPESSASKLSPITRLCLCAPQKLLAVGHSDGTIVLWDLDNFQCKSTFAGHKNAVQCLEWDWFSLRLASGGRDNVVVLWDIVNECGVFRLRGHNGAITQCRFIAQREILATSSKDSCIKFWDLMAHFCFFTLSGHHSEIWDFVFLKDYTQLITGSTSQELRVYQLQYLREIEDTSCQNVDGIEIGQQIKKLKLECGENDEKKLADQEQQANELITCKHVGSLLRHAAGRLISLEITKDERTLICISNSTIVEAFRISDAEELQKRVGKRMRKAKKQQRLQQHELDGEPGIDITEKLVDDLTLQFAWLGEQKLTSKPKSVTSCVLKEVKSDNEYVKVCFSTSCNSIEEWKFEIENNKTCKWTHLKSLSAEGHRNDVRALCFTSDGAAFLSCSSESVKLWNKDSLRCIRTISCDQACSVAVVPGDRHGIVATKKGAIILFDLINCDELQVEANAHLSTINSISMWPNQRGFISCSIDKQLKFWRFDLVDVVDNKNRLSFVKDRTLELSDEVLCARISSDNRLLAVGLLDNTIKVFFVDSLKFFLSLYGHSLPVNSIDISSDSKLLISGSADRNVKIWGLDFGDCHRSLFAHDDAVTCVYFLPNSHEFVSAGKDNRVKRWDADKFEKIQTLFGHHGEVWAMSVSPTGFLFVTASHDKSMRLWVKSDDLIVLQEEQEEERDKEVEKALLEEDNVDEIPLPGAVKSVDVSLASRKTIDAVRGAENIMEALNICKSEQIAISSDKNYVPHPLITALGSSSLPRFVVDVLRRVKSADLERCLLMISFADTLDLLPHLADCIEQSHEIELCTRVLFFLLRVHHFQLINSLPALRVVDRVRKVTQERVRAVRDMYGFNLAALRFIEQQFEQKQSIALFSDVQSKKKQRSFCD